MLCSECEGLFNKRGEEWVIENCWHSEQSFPLFSALTATTPVFGKPGSRMFDARNVLGVDLDRLVYFGASIFWRTALHGWRIGNKRPTRLILWPYEEQLRLFLLGLIPFPSDMFLIVALGEAQDSLHNQVALLPYGGRTAEGHTYRFIVPGIMFMLVVGRMIPRELWQITAAPSGFLLVAADHDKQKLDGMFRAVKGAPPRGKFASRFE
jgi:hypothetical protein